VTLTLQHPRYHFDHWIASGGMGEVWQATDTLLEREVAVKVLRPEHAQDEVFRARFAAEARHAAALQHPHVASVLDYGEMSSDGGGPLPFLVMELVPGQPLSALLAERGALAPEVAADLIAQAAEGLEAAHAFGIIHRDVKPANLLVSPEGLVKVTDFGVARADDAAALTMTGHLVGTPHYLSPEQAEGGSATAVSDVYALGIVLFECLTGRKPFVGETPVATAVMQIREPLPPLPAAIPQRLQRIAQVATAKDPAARFRSAGAMAAALRDESPDTRSYLLPEQEQLEEVAVERERRELVGVRQVLVALVVLFLVGGGVWAMTASTDEPAGAPSAAASKGAVRVRVRADDYVGLPVTRAEQKLRDLHLRVGTTRVQNPGGEQADTVSAVSPTGLVAPGTRILLSVWSAPPAPPTSTGPTAPSPASHAGPGPGTGPGKSPGKKPGKKPGHGPGKKPGKGHGPGHKPGPGPGHGHGGGPGGKPGKGGKR